MHRVGMVPNRRAIVDYIVEKKIVPQEDIIKYFNTDENYESGELFLRLMLRLKNLTGQISLTVSILIMSKVTILTLKSNLNDDYINYVLKLTFIGLSLI